MKIVQVVRSSVTIPPQIRVGQVRAALAMAMNLATEEVRVVMDRPSDMVITLGPAALVMISQNLKLYFFLL